MPRSRTKCSRMSSNRGGVLLKKQCRAPFYVAADFSTKSPWVECVPPDPIIVIIPSWRPSSRNRVRARGTGRRMPECPRRLDAPMTATGGDTPNYRVGNNSAAKNKVAEQPSRQLAMFHCRNLGADSVEHLSHGARPMKPLGGRLRLHHSVLYGLDLDDVAAHASVHVVVRPDVVRTPACPA